VLIACGSGGVGKTTTAAALALRAALDGRRVLVCTIDPSRRLATSLGKGQLSGRPRAIDIKAFAPARGGALFAMVLDVKGTFDALVLRHTPEGPARDRILKNRFYHHVSAALAGSHEYMAMEKLLELASDDRFDLVVLDTPPTRHALDFLEAPDRLLGFLDVSVLRFFLRPYFKAGRSSASSSWRSRGCTTASARAPRTCRSCCARRARASCWWRGRSRRPSRRRSTSTSASSRRSSASWPSS
jgi:anion-transporting  ArsA/GET3 family ATPase